MLACDLEASFALAGGVRDASLILDAARSAGVEMSALAGIRARMQQAVDAGNGDLYLAATYLTHGPG